MEDRRDCLKCEHFYECVEKIEVPPLAAIYSQQPPYKPAPNGCDYKEKKCL